MKVLVPACHGVVIPDVKAGLLLRLFAWKALDHHQLHPTLLLVYNANTVLLLVNNTNTVFRLVNYTNTVI